MKINENIRNQLKINVNTNIIVWAQRNAVQAHRIAVQTYRSSYTKALCMSLGTRAPCYPWGSQWGGMATQWDSMGSPWIVSLASGNHGILMGWDPWDPGPRGPRPLGTADYKDFHCGRGKIMLKTIMFLFSAGQKFRLTILHAAVRARIMRKILQDCSRALNKRRH